MLPHMGSTVTKNFVLPKFPYMVCAKGGEREDISSTWGERSLADAALLIFYSRSSTPVEDISIYGSTTTPHELKRIIFVSWTFFSYF